MKQILSYTKQINPDSQMKCNQQNSNVYQNFEFFNLLDTPCVLNFLQSDMHGHRTKKLIYMVLTKCTEKHGLYAIEYKQGYRTL